MKSSGLLCSYFTSVVGIYGIGATNLGAPPLAIPPRGAPLPGGPPLDGGAPLLGAPKGFYCSASFPVPGATVAPL